MSLSSESVLDHIADHLKLISGAQSFWYMLNTSYNHDCHLASWFHLEPKVVVVALALALALAVAVALALAVAVAVVVTTLAVASGSDSESGRGGQW